MVALKVMQLEEWIATLRDDPEDPSAYISTKFLSELEVPNVKSGS